MNLKAFIEQIGDDAAGRMFGVKSRTAKSWRLGERFPRPSQAEVIVRATGGRITMDGIYRRQPAVTDKAGAAV